MQRLSKAQAVASWIAQILAAAILLQTLFFKLSLLKEPMMNRFRPRLAPAAAFAACFVLVLAPAAQAEDPVYQRSGLALGGTDPVAYFSKDKEPKPVEGSSEHSLEWNGATWRFASAENLEKFRAEPEKYAPQYGGYCAWAVSKGYTAKTDPEAWTIVEGKLYLNYNKKIQAKWEEDVPGRIEAADANWPEVIEKN